MCHAIAYRSSTITPLTQDDVYIVPSSVKPFLNKLQNPHSRRILFTSNTINVSYLLFFQYTWPTKFNWDYATLSIPVQIIHYQNAGLEIEHFSILHTPLNGLSLDDARLKELLAHFDE